MVTQKQLVERDKNISKRIDILIDKTINEERAKAEKFRKELIKNSQISFDNKSIVFDREWFYNHVEKDLEGDL